VVILSPDTHFFQLRSYLFVFNYLVFLQIQVYNISNDCLIVILLIIMPKTKYTRENLIAAAAAVKNVLGSVKGIQNERNKQTKC